jgi:hypothetical protein
MNSILNYLPTFKIVEINRSTGNVTGHILSQFKANAALTTKTVGAYQALENGIIVGLNSDLTIGNFDKTVHAQPFLNFVEELNTFMDGLKFYATFEDADGDIYPRGVGLYVGDAFTTDNYAVAGAVAPAFAKVVAGVLTLQDAADADTLFVVEESTLPLGDDAFRFTYIGINVFANVDDAIAIHAALDTGVHGLV